MKNPGLKLLLAIKAAYFNNVHINAYFNLSYLQFIAILVTRITGQPQILCFSFMLKRGYVFAKNLNQFQGHFKGTYLAYNQCKIGEIYILIYFLIRFFN